MSDLAVIVVPAKPAPSAAATAQFAESSASQPICANCHLHAATQSNLDTKNSSPTFNSHMIMNQQHPNNFPFSSVRLSTPAKLDQNQARQANNAPTGAITPPHTSANKPSWTQCWQTHSQHADGPGWRSHRIGSSHKPPL